MLLVVDLFFHLNRIGALLKLFVFINLGFDILVLCSFFRIRYKYRG